MAQDSDGVHQAIAEVLAAPPEEVMNTQVDILDVAEPTKQMKAEMRMAIKPPSEWLRLLCRDWAQENEEVVAATDTRFLHYKSYLKGQLTSQLLCRLSISGKETLASSNSTREADPTASQSIDFWRILGVEDEFDRAHIVANIERFCSLYNIRGGTHDDPNDVSTMGNNVFPDNVQVDPTAAAAAAAAGLSVASSCGLLYPVPMDPNAAATVANMSIPKNGIKNRQTIKSQQRRLKAELREREREAYAVRKAAEKAARAATREERRQRKLAMRKQREEYAQKQKDAALRRAADLVHSNRVPIEITRGAAAAQAAANAAVANAAVPAAETVDPPTEEPPSKKIRSSIVISTATDLDQIVTHSNNLWAKYNAIAKEHNQKVNWIVVAKELGIHVKVREKYARMHARAKSRGFDFVNWGHYRIKDYPQYFLDPVDPAPQDGHKMGVAEVVHAPGKSPVLEQSPAASVTHEDSAQNMINLAAEAAVGQGVISDNSPMVDAAASMTDIGQDNSYAMPVLKSNEHDAAYSALSTLKSVEQEPTYNTVTEMKTMDVVDETHIPVEIPTNPVVQVHHELMSGGGVHHSMSVAMQADDVQYELQPEEGHHTMPADENTILKSDEAGEEDYSMTVPGDNVAV